MPLDRDAGGARRSSSRWRGSRWSRSRRWRRRFAASSWARCSNAGRHPDAEKLSLCQVTTDGANRLQIVCGAQNVRAGLKVAVAMVGAAAAGRRDHQARQDPRRGIERHAVLGARAGPGRGA